MFIDGCCVWVSYCIVERLFDCVNVFEVGVVVFVDLNVLFCWFMKVDNCVMFLLGVEWFDLIGDFCDYGVLGRLWIVVEFCMDFLGGVVLVSVVVDWLWVVGFLFVYCYFWFGEYVVVFRKVFGNVLWIVVWIVCKEVDSKRVGEDCMIVVSCDLWVLSFLYWKKGLIEGFCLVGGLCFC